MMAIRGPMGIRKPGAPVRRCLFGPPDHEKVRRDLDRSLKNMDESSKEMLRSKWGYDPDTGCGVPGGRFEFTKVKDSEYVPAFYRKGYKTRTVRSVDRVEKVSTATQVGDAAGISVQTVSSSTQAGQGLDVQVPSPSPLRTAPTAGVRKLDFKENCVNSGHSSGSRTSRSSSGFQTTMINHFPSRKRRSPEIDTVHKAKSPRL